MTALTYWYGLHHEHHRHIRSLRRARCGVKEATARIKINKLLEAAGWRFFGDENGPANIRLEPAVAVKSADLDAMGENFERAERGFVDFLLLDPRSFPLIVLEAKAEDKNPLVGKEQARKYAKSQNCRFVTLSSGSRNLMDVALLTSLHSK
jgi:type I restriction enzyme R subunit